MPATDLIRELDRLTAEVASLRAGVTALEATAAELRASEAAYRDLVDEASDWVWAADHVGTLTFSNPAGRAMLGYGDLVGVPAAELTHPDDRAALTAPGPARRPRCRRGPPPGGRRPPRGRRLRAARRERRAGRLRRPDARAPRR